VGQGRGDELLWRARGVGAGAGWGGEGPGLGGRHRALQAGAGREGDGGRGGVGGAVRKVQGRGREGKAVVGDGVKGRAGLASRA
jgi:hypothetical protein